ncbi:hypothetical protein Tco_1096415 [Tanacetum coccineum]
MAKYQRPNSTDTNVNNNNVNMEGVNHTPKTTTPAYTNIPFEKPSFASIVHGNINSKGDSPTSANIRSISLNDQDLLSIDDSSRVLLVKRKEVDYMSNVYKICRNEGFMNLKIYHVGGLWIWILFPMTSSCSAFQANESLKRLSSALRTISPSFKVDERMISIERSSLPLCAWGSVAFKKAHGVLDLINDLNKDKGYNDVDPYDVSESNNEATRELLKPKPLNVNFQRRIMEETKIFFIHEMKRIIEVGDSLGFDARRCRKSLKRMIDSIGFHIADK